MTTEINTTKNILLVEDDPQDVELTLMALEEYSLISKALVVRNGAEALDYLYQRGKYAGRSGGHPSMVLLDLKMPKLNGLEVLRCMKTDEQLKIIPVVVLSSSREGLDLIECYKLGVNAYVVKPMDFAKFMKTVKQLALFWATINEPPPERVSKKTGQPSEDVILPILPVANHEDTASHPTLGR